MQQDKWNLSELICRFVSSCMHVQLKTDSLKSMIDREQSLLSSWPARKEKRQRADQSILYFSTAKRHPAKPACAREIQGIFSRDIFFLSPLVYFAFARQWKVKRETTAHSVIEDQTEKLGTEDNILIETIHIASTFIVRRRHETPYFLNRISRAS